MRIILAPAKKMNANPDTLAPLSLPVYLDRTEEIKAFDRLGYVFRSDLSSETEYVFERI